MRVNDAITGSVLIAFAIAMIGYARTFPSMPGQDYGPALFPTLIGAGFILCGLILVAGGVMRRTREPWFQGGAWFASPTHLARFAAIVVGLVLYILLSDVIGFIPTAFALLGGWLILFRGGRVMSSLVIALVVTLVVDYAFTNVLLVPLPLGLLEQVLY